MSTIAKSDFEFTPHAPDHGSYYCGLIGSDALKLAKYKVCLPEDMDFESFDQKCTLSNGGNVNVDGQICRIDNFIEHPTPHGSGNHIRSIARLAITNSEGFSLYVVTSLIEHENGEKYVSVHPFVVEPTGSYYEPDVGSFWIAPGAFSDILDFYRVGDNAIPL